MISRMIWDGLAVFGAAMAIGTVSYYWERATRGEFRCPTCGTIKPLPKDP